MSKYLWAVVIALAHAGAASAGEVKVSEAWARATAPGQDSAMMQLVITSKKAGALIGGTSKIAQTVEIHTMVMEGNVMKMRQVDSIQLSPDKAVDLGAAGYHLMLIGLKKPLKEGTRAEVVLTVRLADGKQEKVEVQADIRPLVDAGHHEHMHH